MKNKKEFELLKQRINDCVEAPESAGRDFALHALESAGQTERASIVPIQKKKTARKAIPTLAAALAVVLISSLVIAIIPKNKNHVISPSQTGTVAEALEAYSDYSAVKKDLKKLQKERFSYFRLFDYAVKSADAVAEDSSFTATGGQMNTEAAFGETFKQVDGVDEDDCIKTNGQYIFYAGYENTKASKEERTAAFEKNVENFLPEPKVFIFRADGKASKLVHTISLGSGEDNEVSGIYLKGDKLIAEISDYTKTTIEIYDISDVTAPKKTASFSQSGFFSASRLIEDKLIVLSNQVDTDDIPFVKCGDAQQKIAADHIYKTENPSTGDFLVISEIDINTGDKVEQAKAVLGGNGAVYCNEKHLFVLTDIRNEKEDDYSLKSQLFKIDLSDGIAFTACAKLSGSVKSQYSMDEQNGVFRVAVTDVNENYENVNRLYTFDKDLNKLGELADFAEGEHIEAVKFVGDTAYVITFETTDPLFVIDLSNPAAPKKLGEVKIEGFSTTLIPVDENHLLGIGTDADNSDTGIESLKLVLFDISDKATPKVADEKVCKHITSEAMHQTKAILKNPSNNCFTLYTQQFTNVTKKYDAEGDYNYYDFEERFGCLSFRAQGEKIVTQTPFTSEKLQCAIGRCTFIGDTIYMVDDNRVIDCTKY